MTTLANEMRRRDVQFGLISICAQGGMGYAMVLERSLSMSAFTTSTSNRYRRGHVRPAGRAGQQAVHRGGLEFEALLDPAARATPMMGAVVLISGKPDNFIAGADIEEFTALTTAAEADGAELRRARN